MTIADLIFNALCRYEGFGKPGKATTNHNPINLRFAGQENATNANGFAQFATVGQGTTAAYRQIWKWIADGMTLQKLVWTQAPPNENNTEAYLEFVRRECPAVDPLEPLINYAGRNFPVDNSASGAVA